VRLFLRAVCGKLKVCSLLGHACCFRCFEQFRLLHELCNNDEAAYIVSTSDFWTLLMFNSSVIVAMIINAFWFSKLLMQCV